MSWAHNYFGNNLPGSDERRCVPGFCLSLTNDFYDKTLNKFYFILKDFQDNRFLLSL